MIQVEDRKQKPLIGKVRVLADLVVQTGLHIGGGEENLDIGGVDKLVIRDPITRYPYIPGSSIKGKLRSILEKFLEKSVNRDGGSKTWRYESDDLADGYSEVGKTDDNIQVVGFQGARCCEISRLFGSTGKPCWVTQVIAREENLEPIDSRVESIQGIPHVRVRGRNSPSRLIARDCHLFGSFAEQLKKIDTGLFMTEWKFENGLDRITAAANPRQIERVPAGAKYHFELVYTIEDSSQAAEDLQNLAIALAILEDDALGGHGSRGYGKVRFENFRFYYRGVDQYRQIARGDASFNQPIFERPDTATLLESFGQLNSAVNERLLPGGNS